MHHSKTAALITLHEDIRARVYPDSRGIATIGVGRNVGPTGPGLRESEMQAMLDNDIEDANSELVRAFPFFLTLSDVRQAVLIDMAHNLGLAGLLKFRRFLAALESRDYAKAAVEMLDSVWAIQVGQRSKRLAKMMLDNKWPEEIGRF